MPSIPAFVWPFVAMLVNLVWSALNMRALAGIKDDIRREFITRQECSLKHSLCEERHDEICRRLASLEQR